jgi:hypothetical protein
VRAPKCPHEQIVRELRHAAAAGERRGDGRSSRQCQDSWARPRDHQALHRGWAWRCRGRVAAVKSRRIEIRKSLGETCYPAMALRPGWEVKRWAAYGRRTERFSASTLGRRAPMIPARPLTASRRPYARRAGTMSGPSRRPTPITVARTTR